MGAATMATGPIGGSRGSGTPALRLVLTGHAPALHRDAAAPVALARLDAALLALLAIDGPTSRLRLLEMLWPDGDAAAARNSLRQRLFRLRRAVGDDVVAGTETLSLAPWVGCELDEGHDELLAGSAFADCPAFADWLEEQRSALARRRRERDGARIDALAQDGRHAEALALAQRLFAADEQDEAALQRLMKVGYLAGQRGVALAAFDSFAAALQAEHGGQAARATRELADTIRRAAAPLAPVRRDIPASVLRPPRLVGREGERARLHAAWSSRRAFWLLGEAGLGKTRLIDEFVAESFARPTDALRVMARPGDVGVPYASLGRALRALVERRPLQLDDPQRVELARVMPEIDSGLVPRAALGRQLALHGAIEALLHQAQRDGLAALVIDDLHFADAASVEMLQALMLGDALAELRWGFAQRPAEGAAAVEALRTALEEGQRVEGVALAPLDTAQLAELVDMLGIEGLEGARLAPQLARHTGGNPMYALETIKHLIVSGAAADGADLPRPAPVGQLIERRLRQLTPQALALARVAAVAGTDFSIELAERVLETRALALTDAWRELETAQVLRANAFAHDLVHEVTLAGVPAPIAAHTHAAVAAWLEARGSEPARIASHWLDAGQPPRALAALHAAAEAARCAMRRKEEADFLARAARIEGDAGDPAAAFGSLRAMIDAIWACDLHALAPAHFDRLEAAAATPRQQAAAQALRASWEQECGRLDEARQRARRAIDLADAAGDEATAADARQRLAEMLDWTGESEAALALLQPLLPWAAERANELERAEFYCRLAIVLDNTERGREARAYHQHAIAAARQAQAWNGVVTVQGNLAISWATAGYMERAIDVLREAMQLAAAHDDARGCAVALPAEMFKSLRDCGRYGEALRWIEPALAAEPGLGTPLLQCHIACAWVHLGQHARAHREIDASLQADSPHWTRAKALQMRARLMQATGQRGARALLEEALGIVRAQTGRRALRASIVLDHALTLAPAGALAAAREVIAEGQRCDLPGMVLAGHIRAMRFAVDAAAADDALAHEQAARAIEDEVAPNDLYPGERWLNAWQALRLAGREAPAQEALRRGVAWVQETRRSHVPEPFRDSFCRANAVNLQLLRAAGAT